MRNPCQIWLGATGWRSHWVAIKHESRVPAIRCDCPGRELRQQRGWLPFWLAFRLAPASLDNRPISGDTGALRDPAVQDRRVWVVGEASSSAPAGRTASPRSSRVPAGAGSAGRPPPGAGCGSAAGVAAPRWARSSEGCRTPRAGHLAAEACQPQSGSGTEPRMPDRRRRPRMGTSGRAWFPHLKPTTFIVGHLPERAPPNVFFCLSASSTTDRHPKENCNPSGTLVPCHSM